MISRYWSVLFAAIALAAVAFGTGAFTVAMHKPEEPQFQRYSIGVGKADGAPSKPIYQSPCIDPQSLEESDLCAQWRAATASEESAFWAMCGVVVTLLGTVGLLITILQGRSVLRQSIAANEISQTIGEAQARAYLSVPKMDFHVDRSPRYHKNFPNFEPKLYLHNSGQTPAINISYYCSAVVCKAKDNSLPDIELIDHHYFINNVMPGEPLELSPACYGLAVEWRKLRKGWSEVGDDTKLGDMPSLKIYGVVFYEDIFRKTFRSAFCFIYHDFTDGEGPWGKDDLSPIQERMPMFDPVMDRQGLIKRQQE
ncbi:hypothetical protein GS397_00870 [Sphingobium yanoikuyae]|uniref:Uncharacterized protein n=1 Tax=Sphingobium yanoikuyae TaxID=13690 RepID=A0A6P1GBT0_SPHYA|nr:hypothetical protein [Sphingobium yanoikuyae]QHD65762.1 hypothetical protein GS397_00870 [Sphingobium yanoikuyae]